MSGFLNADFLLDTKTAQRLFHEVASDLPIIDYHNHLPPQEIASAVLWLSAPDNTFTTGQVLAVDGGFTAR